MLSQGLLDDKSFTSNFGVSDRREIKGLRNWASGIKTLIVDVTFQGGKIYKSFVLAIEDAKELLEMMLEEDFPRDTRKNLKIIRAFFNMSHSLLNIHETSAGAGNTIFSLISSSEFKLIFGSFQSELIAQSHKMERSQ